MQKTPDDRPGQLIDTFFYIAEGGSDSFSYDNELAFSDVLPFSMTLGFDLTLLGGDSLISRGQTIDKEIIPAAIPEPMSMLLLGSGLISGGYLKRRQSKKGKIVVA